MNDSYVIERQSKEEEVDRSFGKLLLIAFLGIGFSVLTFYAVQLFLVTAEARYLVGALVSGLLFLITLVIQSFFVKNFWLLRGMGILEGLIPLTLFIERFASAPSWLLVAGGVAAAAFFAGGMVHGATVLKASLTIRFAAVARAFLPKLLTGTLILVSALFFLNYFMWGNFSENTGRALVTGSLKIAEPIVALVWSGVKLDQTVGDALKAVAATQMRNAPPETFGTGEENVSFSRLPPAFQKKVVDSAEETLRTILVEKVGPLDPQERIVDAAFRIVAGYVAKVPATYQMFAGIAMALALFLSLKGFFSLFLWLVTFFAFLIFKLLVALGFAHIATETVMREFVVL